MHPGNSDAGGGAGGGARVEVERRGGAAAVTTPRREHSTRGAGFLNPELQTPDPKHQTLNPKP